MAKNTIQSIEPQIADMANNWMRMYSLDYKLEQEALNDEIDNALREYFSKNGGKGANRPDAKLLLKDTNLDNYPILIEYKGYKDKLVKLKNGKVENTTVKNTPAFRNINSYAVNGAVHYANALLHFTSYTDIIAIGMTGYKDDNGIIQHEIGVYYVSKSNYGIGQKVGDFVDLSFLSPKFFDDFITKVKQLSLSPEDAQKLKEQREREIDVSLTKLNNDIYQEEKGLSESDRVYLVAASIIATLGIPNKVRILEKKDLRSDSERGNTDGDIILRKVRAFLNEKKLPQTKKETIIRTLQNTLTSDSINRVENGESRLKRVFSKIVDDLGIYYKIGLTTDFTGKLFNEMYGWLGFSQDKLNDVVLTPTYVANLLVKLARINKDSYVWDFATGSAGLLVAAMNEMLTDARKSISSPEKLQQKNLQIKAEQLLGLEILQNVYMLAVLNMILMGDGSSNILNEDSLTDFDGNYGYGKPGQTFPATAFILNPPYSAKGNGMIFVEKALNMMNRGYAAIIIQNSAGSGKAASYNKRILLKNTLLASIKMPSDLFLGKSSVQTFIYVFRVNEPHEKEHVVKFIDFSNDGYTRSNRKKSSTNLRNTDRAEERYNELVKVVQFGKSKLNILTKEEYYEDTIDPDNGADWNKSAAINVEPTISDFKNTVSNFLSWKVDQILGEQSKKEDELRKTTTPPSSKFKNVQWKKIKLGDLFEIQKTSGFNKDKLTDGTTHDYVTRTSMNQGVLRETGVVDNQSINQSGTWSLGLLQMDFFYRAKPWYAGQFVRKITPKFKCPQSSILYITALLNKQKQNLLSVLVRDVDKTFKESIISMPVTKEGKIDFEFIERFIVELETERIAELEAKRIAELEAYLEATGLDNYKLTRE